MESNEGIELKRREIEEINGFYTSEIDKIMDPGKHDRKMEEIKSNPLLAVGLRGFERLKWQLEEGFDVMGKSSG